MMDRRIPRPRELAPLIQFKKPTLNPTARRLADALTIADLRRIAKRRTPKAAFDYTDGAAEEELSLARARQAFRDIEFHPTILRNVAEVDTGWDVLGGRVALPFGIAPTGFTRLMHTEGEVAGAHAAARAGIPFSLVDVGHHVDRGRQGREPERPQLVSAVHVEGPGPLDGAGRTRRRGRVRHPAGHGRRSGRGRAPARHPQRHVDPAGAHPAHRAGRGAPPAVVVRPADHRTAVVRVAGSLAGHGRRVPGHHVRPDA